jgi:Spy/CpxP family protein refolding chaperone
MKKLLLSAAFLAVGTFAFAQQNGQTMKKDQQTMEQRQADHFKKMQTELNLTETQVAQLKTLHEKRMAERKMEAPQRQAERKAKMEKMKAKRAEHQAEMKKILSPDQYQKWMASNQQKMQKKRQMMHKKGDMMKKHQMQKAQ